jgi:hypothetical protein
VFVRIDDPPAMNVLGLFLASALRRNLIERKRPCALRGALEVGADGMRACVRFEEGGATVTRAPGAPRASVSGPMPALVDAIVRRRLLALLRVRVRGSRLFALRALKFLAP